MTRFAARYLLFVLAVEGGQGALGFPLWSCRAGDHIPSATSATRRDALGTSLSSTERQRLRDFAALKFNQAGLYKPREEHGGSDEATYAPLIVEEGATSEGGMGAVIASPRGGIGVDSSRPVVYAGIQEIEIADAIHTQWVYVWFYPVDRSLSTNVGDAAAPAQRTTGIHRALVITLDHDRFPYIHEVAGADMAGRRFFVSSSLEKRAKEVFGGPVDDRNFAVERSPWEAPATVVLRTVEDGPIPMGPYVYLRAGTREVTTLLCRCSPAQVEEFTETTHYELRPLEELTPLWPHLNAELRALLGENSQEFGLGLNKVLRLPSGP